MNVVIIIGATRSGTKFLRDALGQAQSAAVVPHDVNYIWRTGNEGLSHDELRPQDLSDRNKASIRSQLTKVAGYSGSHSILIEKTVSNCLRVDAVRSVFPDAKFVHLRRDPYDAIESIVRQWREPLDKSRLTDKLKSFPLSNWRYAAWFIAERVKAKVRKLPPVWGVRYDGIAADMDKIDVPQMAARQWKACEAGWANRTPNPQLEFEISYVDIFDPGKMSELCSFVGIEDSSTVLDHIKERGRPVIGSWPGVLTQEEQALVKGELDS